VGTRLGSQTQNEVAALHGANGQVREEISIDNAADESASCAQSVEAGSCEAPVPDTDGEATSKWKRRLACY
jgi:hypothetical protein